MKTLETIGSLAIGLGLIGIAAVIAVIAFMYSAKSANGWEGPKE